MTCPARRRNVAAISSTNRRPRNRHRPARAIVASLRHRRPGSDRYGMAVARRDHAPQAGKWRGRGGSGPAGYVANRNALRNVQQPAAVRHQEAEARENSGGDGRHETLDLALWWAPGGHLPTRALIRHSVAAATVTVISKTATSNPF